MQDWLRPKKKKEKCARLKVTSCGCGGEEIIRLVLGGFYVLIQ